MSKNFMLALGNYRFSVSTAAFQSLERTSEYRWAQMNTFGTRPANQFVGIGKDEIRLKGVIFPHYKGGLAQIDAMRATAANGQPLKMVSSTGEKLGKWVIVSIQEAQSHLINGQPLKQEFTVVLRYYGDKS